MGDKAEKAAYAREWRAKNKERLNGELRAKRAALSDEERAAKRAAHAAYLREYYQRNKDRYRERKRAWRSRNPEQEAEARRKLYERNKASGKAREYHLNSRYGITLEQEKVLFAEQGGRCAICQVGLPTYEEVLHTPKRHLDHDHATGKVRAILCLGCNQGLGRFRDNPRLLRAAAAYIEAHRGES